MVQLSPGGVIRSARRVATDPRLTGVAGALPRTAAVLDRARRTDPAAAIPGAKLSAALAAQVMLDEVLINVMRDPRLFPHGTDYERAGQAIRDAHGLWEAEGWLRNPVSYHRPPPVPAPVTMTREKALDQRFEHMRFASGYEPPAGAPGRDKWLAHGPNHTAHAWLLRHADPSAPWLVCLHGFGMGRPTMDLRAFRTAHLHWELGMNVALVVLPLHGPRQEEGSNRGEGFMSIDLVDSVHGLAQAAWDTRSVISWIRARGGPDVRVGVYGISLGGYTSALVASLEPGLSCAIAGIPAIDIPDLFRRHSTAHVRRRSYATGALGPTADAVHSVVSPLALEPQLERSRRFVFAGIGDRMSTAGQAHRLWEHWGRPAIEWYPGGHIGFFLNGGVSRFVDAALASTGMTGASVSPSVPDAAAAS